MRLVAAVTCLSFTACVTTHTGDEIRSRTGAFSLSCEPRSDVATEHFQVLGCTIENKTGDWITTRVERIEFAPSNSQVKISSAADISDFQSAFAYAKTQEDHNRSLLLAGLITVGFVAMAAGGRGEAASGLAAVVGGAGTGIGYDERERYQNNQFSGMAYSANHLLVGPFRVPPGLYTRKFFMVEHAGGTDRPEIAKVCFAEPETECIDMPGDPPIAQAINNRRW